MLRGALPWLLLVALALALPFAGNDYWAVIASRAAIYWVLVAGLNLVVGFGGQLAIGYVALLTLGAYTASVLVARTGLHPFLAFAAAGVVGAVAGVIVGLPALRLRTFYFAMTTLGFATIVTQVALAWQSVTGGGIGVPGPVMPAPFDTPWGFYLFCLFCAVASTWMTANVARSRFGRALVAIRDAEVAAEATGISKPVLLLTVFLLSGASGGGGRRAVRHAAILHHARCVHLRPVGAVLHRHPDRRARLHPRPAARHHPADRAARVRRAAGGVVHLPLCRAAAGHRARDTRRHCRPAGFPQPQAAGGRPGDHSASGAADRDAGPRRGARPHRACTASC